MPLWLLVSRHSWAANMSLTRNNPTFTGERLTPRAAIRKNCRWCNGGNPKSCPVSSCPRFLFRLSDISDAPTTPLRAIRAGCLDCAGSAEAVRDCTAYKPFLDIPECALWPHREGKRLVTEEYREARRAQANKQHREPVTGRLVAPQEPPQE